MNQDNTVAGEWAGDLAKKFGLSGAVTEEQFSHLSKGQEPNTGD